MESPRETKNNLSKNLLQMKFMQRSALRIQKEDYEAEHQKFIDDEHWRLDLPELAQKESKYVVEPSYQRCEELGFARLSFKGFNREIEKLMRSGNEETELDRAAEREKETSVNDEDMAQRYTSLVGTIGQKFAKKRQRPQAKEQSEEEEELQVDVEQSSPKSKKLDKRSDHARRGSRGRGRGRGGKSPRGRGRGGKEGGRGGRYF